MLGVGYFAEHTWLFRETTFIDLGPVKAALVYFDACISLVGDFGRDGAL